MNYGWNKVDNNVEIKWENHTAEQRKTPTTKRKLPVSKCGCQTTDKCACK